MRPRAHLLSALALGSGAWLLGAPPMAVLAGAGAAVLPDVDHLLEYAIYIRQTRKKPVAEEFWTGIYFEKKGTLYVVLHAYEYAVLLALIALFTIFTHCYFAPHLALLAIGYSIHLLLDRIGNHCVRSAYFITFRRHVRWRIDLICPVKPDQDKEMKSWKS